MARLQHIFQKRYYSDTNWVYFNSDTNLKELVQTQQVKAGGLGCQPQRVSVGRTGKGPRPGQHRAPCPPRAPRIHALTLSNPLPAGPPVAQDEGAEADDHHQYQNHPEEHRS